MADPNTQTGQKTVYTPGDLNIHEDQKRIRLEQLDRQNYLRNVEQDPYVFSESFTFRFRQYKNTNFAGLWELAILDKKGHIEELICDADALPNVLEAIENIFTNRGF